MPILQPANSLDEIISIVFAELNKGCHQKKHPFKNLVLSTVNNNRVSSRWVVFRKITENQRFLIFTDSRSEKVEELRTNPICNLLFYHSKQGLQIRVNGQAKLHQHNELTQKFWPGVKSTGARDYISLKAPGTIVNSNQEGNEKQALNDQNFMIIEFIPSELDVLQLGRETHIRAFFKMEDENWKGSFAVP